jgi:hypothetical protein
VGAADPRLNHHGDVDFRLTRQYSSYKKTDPPPTRVKPIPLALLHHVFHWATVLNLTNCQQWTMIGNLIYLAFFFLLRPGEYCFSSEDAFHPFRLCDVGLYIGARHIDIFAEPEANLWAATSCTLMFSTQKNGTRGEIIGHARSGALHACPVTCIIRLILHARQNNAPPTLPLCAIKVNNTWQLVTSPQITGGLRLQVAIHGFQFGLVPADISAKSLRASGAMALLLGGIDADRIKLVGRWKTDEMLRYLHAQAEPVMRMFTSHACWRRLCSSPSSSRAPTSPLVGLLGLLIDGRWNGN